VEVRAAPDVLAATASLVYKVGPPMPG